MKKWNLYLFTFGFFLNSYIFTMELAEKENDKGKKHLKQVITQTTINNREDLAKFALEKKGVFTHEELDAIELSPDLTAQLMVSLGLEHDKPLPMQRTLLKSVRSLPRDAERNRRFKKTFLEQAHVHDGDLTAGSITQRRKEVMTASGQTPTTDEDKKEASEKNKEPASQKLHLNMEDIKKQQLKDKKINTSKKNNTPLYDEDLEKAKQEMRELILAAADDAIKDKDWESKRNLYIGSATTILAALVGPLVTYFATPSDCPPASNSTDV